MLGFLGTVIGITQTLGGLDFANGSAAVENLKSGLYVAFDTTALGLVLSVVAIFVQFPIERSEQRLLADIDARVGHLVSASLPSDETSDNQTALIADLCRGVQAAVAESLDNQTRLWAKTIDEAQLHWQRVQEDSANKISEALERTLLPALNNHAASIAGASEQVGTQIVSECDRWHDLMTTSHQASTRTHEQMCRQLLTDIETQLSPALTEHAQTIKTVTDKTSLHFDEQCQHHAGVLTQHSDQLESVLNALSVSMKTLQKPRAALQLSQCCKNLSTRTCKGLSPRTPLLTEASPQLVAMEWRMRCAFLLAQSTFFQLELRLPFDQLIILRQGRQHESARSQRAITILVPFLSGTRLHPWNINSATGVGCTECDQCSRTDGTQRNAEDAGSPKRRSFSQ